MIRLRNTGHQVRRNIVKYVNYILFLTAEPPYSNMCYAQWRSHGGRMPPVATPLEVTLKKKKRLIEVSVSD